VQRIQNEHLYQQYWIQKEKMKKRVKDGNEMRLFHGTAEASIEKIIKKGFDRSYSGESSGCSFGQGVYFARDSSYSNSYAKPNALNERKMFIACVLVGESCVGNKSMRRPPEKANNESYDSTTDQSQSIFVCYNDNQCYPEYLITYR
jgi:hypothetical protein